MEIAERTRVELSLDDAIRNGVAWLHENQEADGSWAGMLESNACIESEWLLAFHFLGVKDDPKRDGLVRGILDRQRDDGSWEIYHQAPSGDINATVEAYAALRSVGMDPESTALRKARAWIHAHGGLRHVRVFTRYWLALIDEWPWEHTPALTPEIIYFPNWFPFSIYNFASWARATLLPLSILSVRRPVKRLPNGRLDELFPAGRESFDFSLSRKGRAISWERFFLFADRLLHIYRGFPLHPGREAAIKRTIEWIIQHQDADGAWGGIQPPWIYSLLALHQEGLALDHPVIAKGLDALNQHWSYERNGSLFIQASESPVWDTLLALLALQDCEQHPVDHGSMQRAAEWILEKEIRSQGDWQVKVRNVEPSGWAFERANTWYPDIDDTGVALVVLARLRDHFQNRDKLDAVIERAKEWTIALQCDNGGWAAFDKNNDRKLLTKIPFCDFGEALDPPSVDVTAHVLEALGLLGMDVTEPVVARALSYVHSEQETDGSWFGRWGVNHIYGTAAMLPALSAIGEDMDAPYIRRAADWVADRQNADGGWGESCASYMDDAFRGNGDSTASQTGWALIALVATQSREYLEPVRRGVDFLIRSQVQGTWDEPQYTGTGFPGYGVGERIDLGAEDLTVNLYQGTELSRGFMINYNLYRHYFPLMALGRARRYLRAHI